MTDNADDLDGAGGDERAILEQMRMVRAAHARGEEAVALELHEALVARYGLMAIVDTMHQRDVREKLGTELGLLRVFGPSALYGPDHL